MTAGKIGSAEIAGVTIGGSVIGGRPKATALSSPAASPAAMMGKVTMAATCGGSGVAPAASRRMDIAGVIIGGSRRWWRGQRHHFRRLRHRLIQIGGDLKRRRRADQRQWPFRRHHYRRLVIGGDGDQSGEIKGAHGLDQSDRHWRGYPRRRHLGATSRQDRLWAREA
jgi:hypothetical protein